MEPIYPPYSKAEMAGVIKRLIESEEANKHSQETEMNNYIETSRHELSQVSKLKSTIHTENRNILKHLLFKIEPPTTEDGRVIKLTWNSEHRKFVAIADNTRDVTAMGKTEEEAISALCEALAELEEGGTESEAPEGTEATGEGNPEPGEESQNSGSSES